MRPTWAEISIKALSKNFLRVKEIVGDRVKVMSVVKADAYGHGAIKVSMTLEGLGSDMFGVASVDEGLELYMSGIKAPIVILGGIYEDEINSVVKYGFIPAIYSSDILEKLNNIAYKNNLKIKYHLKVDTGMNRLGIKPIDLVQFLQNAMQYKNVTTDGIFTHLSSADLDERSYTEHQIDIFNKSIKDLKKERISFKYIHVANSPAIQRYPKSHFNLVRPGIMIYGAYGDKEVYLHPVMKLKSRIVQIKKLPAGSRISYGGTYITKKPTKIAVLPIGYADGYIRQFSNKALVSINGTKACVIGRVCMDLTIIDVTDIDKVKVGDDVTLFGDENINIDELAEMADTISYELLTNVGKRVPRVYI